MFHLILPVLALVVVPQLAADQKEGEEKKGPDPLHPRVKMETSLGDIVLELNAEKAPITVDNFLHYATDGFYNDTVFHRVMSTFMIQGGGFTTDMEQKKEELRAPIKNEWRNGLKNVRGTIVMARRGWHPRMAESMKEETANSATSQFFINVVDNKRLDLPQADGAAYCVFGKVVEGLDVVDAIRGAEVIKHPKYASPTPVTPKETIVIKSVTLLDGVTYAQVAAAVKPLLEAAAKAEQERAKAERARAFKELIAKGVDENGNQLHKTESGLMYVILRPGDGASPGPTDRVEAHYTGWLMDGTKFDSSVDRGAPAKFDLDRVIKGWTEGVGLMKVGAKHRLIIPPELGYGERGTRRVPPNSTLVFDVELLGIP